MAAATVFHNISHLMTLKGVVRKQGRYVQSKDLSVIKKAAMVVEAGRVAWVGTEAKLPSLYKKAKRTDCQGAHVYPGFVDCHTHMIFAGDRIDEFERRNSGVSYQEIASQGGGILSTVRSTRKTAEDELVELGQQRVNTHVAQGVTTAEIKSGYGLNFKTESKILRAARRLKKINVVTTYLGAHAVPKGQSSEDYLRSLKKDLKKIKDQNLSDRVDIFIEKGYFDLKQGADYLRHAQNLGFDITIHADQMNRTGATTLAVQLGALSADHVIELNAGDKAKLAASNTVAVLLPSADFYLQCPYPDARTLIDRGACVALASDFNPGSSPTQNMSFVGELARLQMKMSLAEVFAAMTYGGAKALGLEAETGALVPGRRADFFLSDRSWKYWFYGMNETSVKKTFVKGRLVHRQK